MSMPQEMTIQCTECDENTEVTVLQSINDSWPDAVSKIISGELFAFACPHCGRKDHLEYDLLFNDFGHQAWIQVVHEPEMISSHEQLFDFQTQYMPDVRFRIVHNTHELREKVLAFSLGKDDRVVELCKVVTWEIAKKELPDFKLSWNPIYTRNPETGQETFLLFGENGEEKVALMDDMLYNSVEQKLKDRLECDDSTYIYDFEWAEDFLNQ